MNFKKLAACFIIFSLILGNMQWVFAAGKSAKVVSFTGTVTIRRSGGEKDIKPFKNMTLQEGDKVTTGADGNIKISIDDNKYITAGKSSSFTISNLKGSGSEAKTGFTLIYGSVSNEVNQPSTAEDTYTIRTANTVMGVRSTVFKVTRYISNQQEVQEVIVLDGTVYVKAAEPDIRTSTGTGQVVEVEQGQSGKFTTDESGNLEIIEKEDIQIGSLDSDTLDWIVDNAKYNPELAEKAKNETNKGSGNTSSSGGGGSGSSSGSSNNQLNMEKYYQSLDGSSLIFEFNRPIDLSSNVVISPAVSFTPTVTNAANGIIEIPTSIFTSGGTVYDINFSGVKLLSNPSVTCQTSAATYMGDSYNISDIEMLQYFHDGFVGQNIINLNTDINMGGYDLNGVIAGNWTPVDISNKTFDGQNHKITGLQIDTVSPANYSGFFGLISSNATVKNLTLENATLNSNAGVPSGMIAGMMNTGAVENCTVGPNVNITTTGASTTGGVVGGATGGATTISNCKFLGGNINSDGSEVGGIVGAFSGPPTLLLTNPVVSGNVSITATGMGTGKIGGVAGSLQNVTVSVNAGSGVNCTNLTINAADSDSVGGFAGDAVNSQIAGASVTGGTININANNGSYVGGVFGSLGGNTSSGAGCSVTNASFQANGGIINGNQYVGGITGGLNGTGSSSIDLSVYDVSSGFNLTALNDAGGIAGVIGDLSGAPSISRSYAKGGSILAPSGDAGGIAAEQWAGTISNCYSALSSISGGGYVGGIVGANADTVNSCHSQSPLSGVTEGGIVAGNSGTVSDCVFLDTTTATAIGVGAGTNCLALTAADMANEYHGAFSGVWDFITIWYIGSDYPELIDNN